MKGNIICCEILFLIIQASIVYQHPFFHCPSPKGRKKRMFVLACTLVKVQNLDKGGFLLLLKNHLLSIEILFL
ncbi:hypothetical protein AAH994_13685, partial [Weeksellaceae bacterium A-14]